MIRRIRLVPGRPGRSLPASTLVVLGLCLVLQAPSGASESGGGTGLRLLASEGALFFWDGASTELRPAPAGLASAPPGFRAVLPLDEGRVLLVEPADQPPGKQKEKKAREGEAVVVGLAEAGAARGAVVAFEGAPSAAAVSPDGRRAYVVSWRGTPESGGRGWLHAIDVDQGAVADSSLLSAPAFGLAADKAGGRLYLGLKDRIQTYGADPVRVSWQYRSPGQNGPLALSPEADLLAVGRGSEVALFDPARLQAIGADERRARKDDATTVASVPFVVTRLVWSEDGSLLAAIGSQGLVFVDPGNGALLWPPPHAIDFASAKDAMVLRFPGSDHDLVVALAPAGTVSALRAPVPAAPVAPPPAKIEERPTQVTVATAAPPPASAAPAHVTNGKLPQETAGNPQGNSGVEAETAEPPPAKPAEPAPGRSPEAQVTAAEAPKHTEPTAKPAEPTATQHDAPAAEESGATAPDEGGPQDSRPPRLRGRVSGKGARSIVLYGPNNILKEAIRVELQADGSWSLDLPAPGTYRVVPIGDGSTPIPVVPTFRTVTVRAGISESGLDFAVR